MRFILKSSFLVLLCAKNIWAADATPAYEIGDKKYTLDDVAKNDQSEYYDAAMKMYEFIDRAASQQYLEEFWQKKAKESKISVEAARQAYTEKNVTVKKSEIKDILDKNKDNPELKKLKREDQEKRVTEYLKSRGSQALMAKILEDAKKKGELKILYSKPQEPVYTLAVTEADHTRFGPGYDDVKPMGCDRGNCAVTVIEYSEFQCPYCEKVLPDVKRILKEYKGKVSWTVRDFPLSFHNRAKPAAIAAKCAADQGKYWNMYGELFANQRSLEDADFEKYAAKINLDKGKFKECVAKPESKLALIETNIASGAKYGINGTPAFFINGRKLSGALPYTEFKRVIDDELSKKKKG